MCTTIPLFIGDLCILHLMDQLICLSYTGKVQNNWDRIEVIKDKEDFLLHVKIKVMRLY